MLSSRNTVLILLLVLNLSASAADTADTRTALPLTPAEQAEFLAEMRQMLASIQGIIAGIGTQDREKIATAARTSGNRMACATPESIRQKLPQEK